jgi:hypothetical protein
MVDVGEGYDYDRLKILMIIDQQMMLKDGDDDGTGYEGLMMVLTGNDGVDCF